MTMISNEVKLDFSDVLFVPQRSTWDTPQHRAHVDLKRNFKFKHATNVGLNCIPIIAANMDMVGTMKMAETLAEHQMLTALHKFYSPTELFDFFTTYSAGHTFYSMGISDDDYSKFNDIWNHLMVNNRPRLICIDVANGYTEKFIEYVKKIRRLVETRAVIMAGNVVTPDITIELIRAGADIVKVGIGSGSVCTTRKMTGVGYPQFSAVQECANAAHGQGGHICSDGGIVQVGDFGKAFGAGADFVMSGGMFSGHEECEGELIMDGPTTFDGKKYIPSPGHMKFRGMSSAEAMIDHYGEKASHRAAEGKEVLVPYKGSVNKTVEEILGGLRSTCTYIGAKKLKDIPKCSVFIRVNRTHNTVYGE